MRNFSLWTFIFASLLGCSSTLLKGSRSVATVENPQCSSSCPSGQVCMNIFSSFGVAPKSECTTIPIEAPIADFVLPFDSNTEVVCTHSSGSGSHSDPNAFYAIDLASDYSLPPVIIRAAADGVAYVFLGEDGRLCPEPQGPPSSSKSSSCGLSWGNRIKILHSGGYVSFYVHLDHPLVENGTFVHQGDPIGVEGFTGAAGHRHLHWSVQKLPGLTAADWVKHISWNGVSVPFHFLAIQNGAVQNFEVAEINCAHTGIGNAPAIQQPRFKGIK
jgi:hypothetical protein